MIARKSLVITNHDEDDNVKIDAYINEHGQPEIAISDDYEVIMSPATALEVIEQLQLMHEWLKKHYQVMTEHDNKEV